MRAALQSHITRRAVHYASNPAVRSWDVVNEVINDGSSPQLRQSFWTANYPGQLRAGRVHFARAADPDAQLCINDYNVEGSPMQSGSKAQRLFQLIQTELAAGTPDHLRRACRATSSWTSLPNLQQSLAQWATLGIDDPDHRAGHPHPAARHHAAVPDPGVELRQRRRRLPGGRGLRRHHDLGHRRRALVAAEQLLPRGRAAAVELLVPEEAGVRRDRQRVRPESGRQPGADAPTNLAASGVTSSGATLTWDRVDRQRRRHRATTYCAHRAPAAAPSPGRDGDRYHRSPIPA
jgi:hypothetical protein